MFVSKYARTLLLYAKSPVPVTKNLAGRFSSSYLETGKPGSFHGKDTSEQENNPVRYVPCSQPTRIDKMSRKRGALISERTRRYFERSSSQLSNLGHSPLFASEPVSRPTCPASSV